MPTPRTAIARLIKQAEQFLDQQDWDRAVARCYQILALEPLNQTAHEKLASIYGQNELVDGMRCALQRLFKPADAATQQRRLAFSYRVLSCWKGWLLEDFEERPPLNQLEETAQIICHAYVHGHEHELLAAWNGYVHACARRPDLRRDIQWWTAKQYAEHGFFADAAEVLMEMLAADPANTSAAYLLAEMRWWRDHSHKLDWLQ